MVLSTVPKGRIASMEVNTALHEPGVLYVMTSLNAPRLPKGGRAGVDPPAGRVLSYLHPLFAFATHFASTSASHAARCR